MIHEVIAPKSGIYESDVRVGTWLVQEGAQVTVGQPLFEMETDKVTTEITAEDAGWLHILVAEGTDVPVGTVVALIGTTFEEYGHAASGGAP